MSKNKRPNCRRFAGLLFSILILVTITVVSYFVFVKPKSMNDTMTSGTTVEAMTIQSPTDLENAAYKVRELQQTELNVEELDTVEETIL